MRKLITSAFAVLAVLGGTLAAAIPASASTAVTAVTGLSGRPDSGGNGNWATDAISRVLAITQTGTHLFTATVTDTGSFSAIAGAYTPNQGGADAGQRIDGRVTGTIAGKASYSFTASTAPQAALVPFMEIGTGTPTSTWYELAFPKGTVFGGAGLGAWSWTYTSNGACGSFPQRWTDAFSTGGGQEYQDGNITGGCSPFAF